MSTTPPTTPLERYLDKQLSEPDRLRMDEALKTDGQAREEVRLQGQIDDSLRRLFGASGAPLVIRPRRAAPWRWALGMAAALLLAAAGAWVVLLRGKADRGDQRVALATVYKTQEARGFVPEQVCTTREKFAEWVRAYYAQALYPKAEHEGVEFVGWAYAPAIGRNSGVLLATVQGRHVIVVLDRAAFEKKPIEASGDPALHSFREQFGSLVLYEVSPLDHPAVLPLLSTSGE